MPPSAARARRPMSGALRVAVLLAAAVLAVAAMGGATAAADAGSSLLQRSSGRAPRRTTDGTVIVAGGGAEPLLQLQRDLSAVLQESDLVGLIGAQAARNARDVATLERKLREETRAVGASVRGLAEAIADQQRARSDHIVEHARQLQDVFDQRGQHCREMFRPSSTWLFPFSLAAVGTVGLAVLGGRVYRRLLRLHRLGGV